ncbi:MAG: sel1 repeat family protein [Lentisphaerae bacterium]|nr:sel1 repeat family protein [Lentisphaerota bacterium]
MLRKILLIAFTSIFAAVFSGAETPRKPSAASTLLEKARRGDAQSQLQLGFAFFQQGNPVRAAYWFNAAAQQNLPEAQYNMGRCNQNGYGVEKNLHTAQKWFELAAAQGLQPAQLALAKLYLSGIAAANDAVPPRPAIPPDEKKAYALLEKLISQNIPEACTIYAGNLISKHYAETPPEKIIQLLEKAVAAQHPEAMLMLADYLLSRQDHHRNEVRARALLQKAAPASPAAMARWAFVVEHGFGAPPDPAQAFELYQKSLAKEFSAQAAVRLANYYFTGRSPIPQDIPYAVKLYRQAADTGHPEALYKLGSCFNEGIGLERNTEEAFELFFQAAKLDYPPAQYAVGRCFELGSGTPQDDRAAFYWYYQAALRYEPRSLLEAGRRMLDGRGTDRNPQQAAILLEQALANGMTEAAGLLAKARRMTQPIQPAPPPVLRFKLPQQP